MKVRTGEFATVVWRDEFDHIHTERVDLVDDQNGWLFVTLVDSEPGDPMGRLIAQHQVVRVDFPNLAVIEAEDRTVFERDVDLFDDAQVKAAQLKPEMFDNHHSDAAFVHDGATHTSTEGKTSP